MKHFVLISSILCLFRVSDLTAQTTETFESFSNNATSFTSGGRTFTLTPTNQFVVRFYSPGGYGYNSSNMLLEHASANAGSISSTGNFTVKSLYLFPSSDDGSTNQTASVSVTFTGRLSGVTQFTYTPPASNFTSASWSNATNRGFSLVNFATPGFANTVINELVIDIGGIGNYIAVDNFTFAASAPLPIILSKFEGRSTPAGNELKWTSSVEINAEKINIEKSTDGLRFKTLASIPANGKPSDYQFTDATASGLAYYRLKLIDLDGTSEYSKLIRLTGDPKASILSVYPNPAKNSLQLSTKWDKGDLVIYSFDGKKQLSAKWKQGEEVDLKNLTKGVYILELRNKDQREQLLFMKQE